MSAAASKPYDAILIIGFGGPEKPEEIRPFIDRVLAGRPVPRERYEEVVRHYEAFGGRSPYNELTRQLARGIHTELLQRGMPIPVAIGYRNMTPGFEETIGDLMQQGARRVLGFILSAFRCEASWDRYQSEVAKACVAFGAAAPVIEYPASWHREGRYIEAAAERVLRALEQFDEADRADAELIYTAHSIPIAMRGCETYVRQLRETAEVVTRVVGRAKWELAFQSRSGSPRDRWLEPDIGEALVTNRKPKVVIPIGFLCDHVEVLYDLDVQAAAVARNAGIRMLRAGTVGNHPRLVEMIAEMAMGQQGRGRDSSSLRSSE